MLLIKTILTIEINSIDKKLTKYCQYIKKKYYVYYF